jgi:hypothetical protein
VAVNDIDVSVVEEAISGTRGADQQRIAMTAIEWASLVLRKNANYGCSVWKRPFLSPGMDVASAILVRMTDKVERIHALMQGKPDEVGESLDDTIRDLGAYCLLYLSRPKGEQDE